MLNNKLVIDIDAYSNTIRWFLGQVQVYVPKGETVGSDAAVIAMLDRNRDPQLQSRQHLPHLQLRQARDRIVTGFIQMQKTRTQLWFCIRHYL